MQEIRIRSSRDDKVEGGGPPWHEWRWMDRVEKASLDETGAQPSLRRCVALGGIAMQEIRIRSFEKIMLTEVVGLRYSRIPI